MEGIKSKDFNAKSAFENLLRTQNLKSLVQTNLDIQAAIKSLDQDVQSLVFENYNKFIGSIDVVRKMREDIEKSEQDLSSLAGSIESIRVLSSRIDDSLRPKREEIQKLDKVNQDLSKLKLLWELPDQFKNDKKVIDSQEFHRMSSEELSKSKSEFIKLLSVPLANMGICKTKLFDFHSEPLVAPIFRDLAKHLQLIQSLLALHFYDNHSKMEPDLLGDLFGKLFHVTSFLEEMRKLSPSVADKALNISLDSLCANYFKFADGALATKLAGLAIGGEGGIKAAKAANEITLAGLKGKLAEVASDAAGPRKLAAGVLRSTLEGPPLPAALGSCGAGEEIMAAYGRQRGEFAARALKEVCGALDAPFFVKAEMLAEVEGLRGWGVASTFVSDHLVPECVEFSRMLCLSQCETLRDRLPSELKSSSFAASADSSLTRPLTESAESLARTLGFLSEFSSENLLTADLEHRLSETLNPSSLLRLFCIRAASLYGNSHASTGPIARSCSLQLRLTRPLRIYHLASVFRCVERLGRNNSIQDPEAVMKLILSSLVSLIQSLFVKVIWRVSSSELSVSEGLNSINNLIVLSNYLSLGGKQKSRLSKTKLNDQGEKISDASKLIARQSQIFEEKQTYTGQILYFGFCKIFFKSFRMFLKENKYSEINQENISEFFVFASQILFDTVEKEEEKLIVHLFYQVIDDFAMIGKGIDPGSVDLLLAKNKDNIF